MYLFERLRNDYPFLTETIAETEKFFCRIFPVEALPIVFDDTKENAKYFFIAYNQMMENSCKPGSEYNRCMAYFEQSLSYDPDALKYMISDTELERLKHEPGYDEHKQNFIEKATKYLEEHNV